MGKTLGSRINATQTHTNTTPGTVQLQQRDICLLSFYSLGNLNLSYTRNFKLNESHYYSMYSLLVAGVTFSFIFAVARKRMCRIS